MNDNDVSVTLDVCGRASVGLMRKRRNETR